MKNKKIKQRKTVFSVPRLITSIKYKQTIILSLYVFKDRFDTVKHYDYLKFVGFKDRFDTVKHYDYIKFVCF